MNGSQVSQVLFAAAAAEKNEAVAQRLGELAGSEARCAELAAEVDYAPAPQEALEDVAAGLFAAFMPTLGNIDAAAAVVVCEAQVGVGKVSVMSRHEAAGKLLACDDEAGAKALLGVPGLAALFVMGNKRAIRSLVPAKPADAAA